MKRIKKRIEKILYRPRCFLMAIKAFPHFVGDIGPDGIYPGPHAMDVAWRLAKDTGRLCVRDPNYDYEE